MSEGVNRPVTSGTEQAQPVTAKGIISETQNILKYFLPIQHSSILNALLNEIKPIDFEERVCIHGKEKLRHKHLLIVCIDEILAVAKRNKWGILEISL